MKSHSSHPIGGVWGNRNVLDVEIRYYPNVQPVPEQYTNEEDILSRSGRDKEWFATPGPYWARND